MISKKMIEQDKIKAKKMAELLQSEVNNLIQSFNNKTDRKFIFRIKGIEAQESPKIVVFFDLETSIEVSGLIEDGRRGLYLSSGEKIA